MDRQIGQIFEQAKQGHVFDIKGEELTPEALATIIKEVGSRRRKFHVFLNPMTLARYMGTVWPPPRPSCPDTLSEDRAGKPCQLPRMTCRFECKPRYLGVRLRCMEWMPPTTGLVVEPQNLTIHPLEDNPAAFSRFINTSRVWIILNMPEPGEDEGV